MEGRDRRRKVVDLDRGSPDPGLQEESLQDPRDQEGQKGILDRAETEDKRVHNLLRCKELKDQSN